MTGASGILSDTQIKILQVLFNRIAPKKGAMQGTKLKDEIGLKDDDHDLAANLERNREFLTALRGLMKKDIVSCTEGDQLDRDYLLMKDSYYIRTTKREAIGIILQPMKLA